MNSIPEHLHLRVHRQAELLFSDAVSAHHQDQDFFIILQTEQLEQQMQSRQEYI